MKLKYRPVRKIDKPGQLVLEYAGVIAFTVVALLTMHVYLNRGLQGKLKESLDSFNEEQWAGPAQSRHMSKTTSTFSYEGGPYEGSVSTSLSSRSDSMIFRSPRP